MRVATSDELTVMLRSVELSAFRLELPTEPVGRAEERLVAAYGRSDRRTPTKSMVGSEWLSLVRRLVEDSRRVERVRVVDEPATTYQEWLRWTGMWNAKAGEVVRYITRSRALEVGLLPDAGDVDWWLLDSRRLVRIHHVQRPHVVEEQCEIVTDPAAVARACWWRDVAMRYSSFPVREASEQEMNAEAQMRAYLADGVKSETIAAALGMLKPREREMLMMRLGLDGGDRHTLREVGEAFGVGPERVRQITWKAKSTLRWQQILVGLVLGMPESQPKQGDRRPEG